MNEPSLSVRSLLEKGGRTSSPASAPIGEDAEMDYSAYAQGRVSRHAQMTLVFRKADGAAKGWSYAYLYCIESEDPNRGFTLDFTHTKVKITGRNLESLFRLVGQHRVAEIREAHRMQVFEGPADTPLVEHIDLESRPTPT